MKFSKETRARWIATILSASLSPPDRERTLTYVAGLMDKGLPPIMDARHFSSLVGIRHPVFVRLLTKTPEFYRSFEIPKRTGGFRAISVPSPILRDAQVWVLKNVLTNIQISNQAHGFASGRSVLSFTKPHLAQPALLHVDIAGFFPSITRTQVRTVFSDAGYSPRASSYLSYLCTLNDELPQGAPTSPYLSNLVARSIDRRLNGVAAKYELKYSRYADNIIMSGSTIPTLLLKVVADILQSEGFGLNVRKSYLSIGTQRRIVTGLSITGQRPRLPKRTKRELRQAAFHLLNKGYSAHASKLGIRDPVYVERLLGRLAFWRFVEPHNAYASQLFLSVQMYSRQLDAGNTGPQRALPM